MVQWKNRIVDQTEMDVEGLSPHELNWRLHSARQQEAVREVFDKVGIVQSVIFNQTTGKLVDGHLRVAMAKAMGRTKIPVTIVELSEEEEKVILATYDPIASLAKWDDTTLDELVNSLSDEFDDLLDSVGLDFKPIEFLDSGNTVGKNFVEPVQQPITQGSSNQLVSSQETPAQTTTIVCPNCGHEF